MDPRVKKLAELLVHYSLKLKKNQLVKIRGEVASMPLIKAVYMEALDAGAYPYTTIDIPDCDEAFLKRGSNQQLSYISPISKLEINKLDAYISIWGGENTKYLSGVDPKRQALRQKTLKPLLMRFFKRESLGQISWVGTQFPTLADAQLAEMSLTEYEDFVYDAGHINDRDPYKYWQKIAKEQRLLVRILNRISLLQIRGSSTDITMQVKGRKWISCHGTENFPDGEIFTSPIENSANGVISFSYPASYYGREVYDVKLEFKNGTIVHSEASKNYEFLKGMLTTDPGAKRIGEIAIGTNYGIQRFTHNVLFDEKIGGTCHMAIGAGIPEAGGKNKSGIHWDMVTEMKKGGEIYGDGRLIYRSGKFTI
ncbi:MAG: aminopeptidase [Candidatus Zixiibacteriota bacterium]